MFAWLRRWFCRHDGPAYPLTSGRIADVGFTVWKCVRCGAPIFEEDETR